MINVKSNAITRNVRILYQLKRTGGSIQYGNHHGNCTFNGYRLPNVYLTPLPLPEAYSSTGWRLVFTSSE